jgi:hypothetical protein
MSQYTKIRPFQYAETDVLNLFAFSGVIPTTAGTAVTTQSLSGWNTTINDSAILYPVGNAIYQNATSYRWGTQAVVRNAGTGDTVVGLTLYDVREVDENGIPLKQYPQKAAENNWILSGQTVPILCRGYIFISGLWQGGTPQAGQYAYASGNGDIAVGVTAAGSGGVLNQAPNGIGRFLGAPDLSQYALLYVDPIGASN